MGIILLAIVIWEYYYGEELPALYRSRGCAGRDGKKKFPTISNHDIRLFFTRLVDGMGFSEKNRLKFKPDDKVNDVCHTQIKVARQTQNDNSWTLGEMLAPSVSLEGDKIDF